MPELQTLHIQNVEDFSIENFRVVAQRLLSYRGLVHLGFELTSFDLDDVKEEFFQILRTHSDTLTHLYIGRNKVSNAFMKEMCENITEVNNLDTLDLTHVKEAAKIVWPDYLGSIAKLSKNRQGNPVRVVLSDYQTRTKHKIFQEYLSSEKPNIEIFYQVTPLT